MSRPYDPDETADDVRASLRREHPELTDADVDRILSGEPARRRPGWGPNSNRVDNRGKRDSRYETPSAGRRTHHQSAAAGDDRT